MSTWCSVKFIQIQAEEQRAETFAADLLYHLLNRLWTIDTTRLCLCVIYYCVDFL